jgi:hypothetical protein
MLLGTNCRIDTRVAHLFVHRKNDVQAAADDNRLRILWTALFCPALIPVKTDEQPKRREGSTMEKPLHTLPQAEERCMRMHARCDDISASEGKSVCGDANKAEAGK